MFHVLEGSGGNVLGVEIAGEYTREDVEAFKEAFEKKIAEGHDRVNILVKIDRLNPAKIRPGAFVEDARYALKHLGQLRHIAVVGHSGVEKVLVDLDNLIFGDARGERIEKYFDVADMDEAWKFVRS